MSAHYDAASRWEDLPSDSERVGLKKLVASLVGYPCKIACEQNESSVDIYVFNIAKNRVTDYIEIQPSGALGVIFSEYPNPDAKSVARLEQACNAYNDKIGVVFEEEDDEESEEDEDEDDESSEEEDESSDDEESGEDANYYRYGSSTPKRK
jgi:hypothetical protein